MSDTAVLWCRRDLRLHDAPALTAAAEADRLLPVYCFDPRQYGERPFGGRDSFRYHKTGPHRVRFRREAVADLRARLRERDGDLVVRHGAPEAVLPELVAAVDADAVHFHTYPTPEEAGVEAAVEDAFRNRPVETTRHWGHTLYHLDDLPVPYTEIDDTYTPFRQRVESGPEPGDPLPVPTVPPTPDAVGESIPPGECPTPGELGVEPVEPDDRGVHPFPGGESAALDRLEAWIWEGDNLREYKQTRNGMLGPDYSAKVSPYLNEGCLSPRRVAAAVDRYETERVANDDTYWLVFELLWRDFFQFQFAKHGARFFERPGIRDRTDIDWRDPATDDDAAREFERWCDAETGVPFVDANLRELVATGYVSNRGRQNVASFLANDLRIDWRRGAAYFETHLVDYDPASNYGNWAYIAGVGNDSRNRSFDVLSQAERYDPEGEYVTHWLPELEPLPADAVHEPWTLSEREQAAYGVQLGLDYPEPVVDLRADRG
ncbi:DASH family cryptochrome [Halobaculum sp. MBLA0147]|uniref:DASH family cryptochrome n=1 Tax=Halobaculum sp. MBLA0147 TaxID=3079934 RepID=UPI00352573B8